MSTHKIRNSLSQLIINFLMADYMSWRTLLRFPDPEQRVIYGKKLKISTAESGKQNLIKKEQREDN